MGRQSNAAFYEGGFLRHFHRLLTLLIVFKSNKKGDGEQQYPNQKRKQEEIHSPNHGTIVEVCAGEIVSVEYQIL